MKIAAALVALAAALAAPLASALDFPPDSTCTVGGSESASAQLLANMVVTNTIKRTSVTGGSRITQTIEVTNNNNGGAARVILFTPYNTKNTVLKGSARAYGAKGQPKGSTRSKSIALGGYTSVFSNQPVVTSPVSSGVPSAIDIPSGKTLKATITYKAPRCPGTGSSAEFDFGPAVIATSFSCWRGSGAAVKVRVTNAKKC